MSDDGGPAFPEVFTDEKWSETHRNFQRDTYSAGGMTLRDWFAGQALTALSRDFRSATGISANIRNIAELNAALAYLVADAMLAERSKPKGGK